MTKKAPVLWSDFDGTAVEIARRTQPRNWSKYPLPMVQGYADFLQGASDGGVEIGGVVSRRPDIFVRRYATMRSVSRLGLQQFFPDKSQLVHAGTEQAKGAFVAHQAETRVVGMLEDRPHLLGAVLLGIFNEAVSSKRPHYPIVMGVVARGALSQGYVKRLEGLVAETPDSETTQTHTGFILQNEYTCLEVESLQAYSHMAGVQFAQKLHDISEATEART